MNHTQNDLLNAYSPPNEEAVGPDEEPQAELIFRSGFTLVVRTGAKFPARCFETGEPTRRTVEWSHAWHPYWVNLLLFLIVPYLIVAPLVSHRIQFDVPISDPVWERHRKMVKLGICLMALSAILFIAWLLFALGSLSSLSLPVLLLSVIVGVIGLLLSSRDPVQLRVTTIKEGLLFLAGVHPNCLRGLPEYQGRI
ncbi:MAG: hypothetical protein AB8B50_00370 [Pirellulaceae bacterium]